MLGAAALLRQAALAGGGGRSGRAASAGGPEGRSEGRGEALQRERAVSRLAALVLGHGADDRAEPFPDAGALGVRERLGCVHVEDGLDPCLGLLRVLAARAARARGAELDLPEGEGEAGGDAELVVGHGIILPPD